METKTTKTFLEMTRERWSVRRFSPAQISDEHMARILGSPLIRVDSYC